MNATLDLKSGRETALLIAERGATVLPASLRRRLRLARRAPALIAALDDAACVAALDPTLALWAAQAAQRLDR